MAQNRRIFDGHTILFPLISINEADRCCSVLVEMLPEYVLQDCILSEMSDTAFVKTLCCSLNLQVLVNFLQFTREFIMYMDEDHITPLMW